MQSVVHAGHFERSVAPERRDIAQPSERLIGRVVACDGARATVSATLYDLGDAAEDFWAIGKLVTINLGRSRVVGLVYEVSAQSPRWDEKGPNTIFVKIELVGEVTDRPNAPAIFRRGLLNYPHLGAEAHRIRSSDLAAVYDLGARGGVSIGQLSQDSDIAATVSIHDMLNRHFAVVGTTGVGKSSAVSLLLRKSVETKPDLRILILDPHNEYASAFTDQSITIDATTLELPFWMFKFEEFSEVVFRGRRGLEDEQEMLRDLIGLAKARKSGGDALGASVSLLKRPTEGVATTADTPVPYRMLDLLTLIDEQMGKLDTQHDRPRLRSLRHRLDSLNKDPRFRFMFGGAGFDDNMERIIGKIFRIPHEGRPITVFQLAGLPSEVVNAVASILSRIAFDLAMLAGGDYEILVLCEEAHRYVPEDPHLGFAPTRQAISRIAKEGRKYGCYLGVVTQRPGELDPTILSQCSTVFAMRLGNDRDQEIIRRAIADSSASTIGFLSSIGNREAIAFGEGVATPMRLTFAHLERQALPATSGHDGADPLREPARDLSLRDLASRMRGMAQQSGW